MLADAFDDYKNGDYISATSKYDDAITMIEELDTRSADDEEEEKNLLLFYAHYYNGPFPFVSRSLHNNSGVVRQHKGSRHELAPVEPPFPWWYD